MILVIKILFGLWGPWLFWFLVTNWLDLNQLTSTYFSIYLCKIKLIAESCLWLCSHWHGMQERQYCYIPWTFVIEYGRICFRSLESYFSKHFTECHTISCLLTSVHSRLATVQCRHILNLNLNLKVQGAPQVHHPVHPVFFSLPSFWALKAQFKTKPHLFSLSLFFIYLLFYLMVWFFLSQVFHGISMINLQKGLCYNFPSFFFSFPFTTERYTISLHSSLFFTFFLLLSLLLLRW